MAFHLPKPVVPLLAIAMGAMVLSAAAQQSGQSIIFSSPQNDDTQSSTPSLVQPGSPPSLPSAMQAPGSPFNYNTPGDFPAVPPPQANSSDQRHIKKLLDDRKNWTLMTPEEIFGVTTEKTSQSEHDALGQEKNQTQLERYLERENQSPDGRTNGWQNDRANSPSNVSRDRDNVNPFDSRHNGNELLGAPQNLNRLFDDQRNGDVPANQNGTVSWDVFSPPAPQAPVKPNLEQLAAMERFRQLLESDSAPATPSQGSIFPAPKPLVDPNFTQPAFVVNPAGASFTPLSSGIEKPAGLTPLPGTTTHFSSPATVPSWVPQPPPWASQTAQPFATPQWKF